MCYLHLQQHIQQHHTLNDSNFVIVLSTYNYFWIVVAAIEAGFLKFYSLQFLYALPLLYYFQNKYTNTTLCIGVTFFKKKKQDTD